VLLHPSVVQVKKTNWFKKTSKVRNLYKYPTEYIAASEERNRFEHYLLFIAGIFTTNLL
jgi:hypothetical protein